MGCLQHYFSTRCETRGQPGELYRPDQQHLLKGVSTPAGGAEDGVSAPGQSDADRGTSIVGTFVGFLIFMILLLFCAQVLLRMYATSSLTAAATRAAEDVAESPVPLTAVPGAEAEAREQLGSFGATRTRFAWLEVDGQQVVLEVRGASPGLLPLPGGWNSISRTVTVRTERFR